MSSQVSFRVFFMVVFYLFLQVLILKNVVLFNYAFCFVYLGAILFLPTEMPVFLVLLLAFFVGLTIDVFYNTGGLHAAVTVFIAFIRRSLLRLTLDRRNSDSDIEIDFKKIGFMPLSNYIVLSVFLQMVLLFFLEFASFENIQYTILKIIASTILSSLVIFLTNLLIEEI